MRGARASGEIEARVHTAINNTSYLAQALSQLPRRHSNSPRTQRYYDRRHRHQINMERYDTTVNLILLMHEGGNLSNDTFLRAMTRIANMSTPLPGTSAVPDTTAASTSLYSPAPAAGPTMLRHLNSGAMTPASSHQTAIERNNSRVAAKSTQQSYATTRASPVKTGSASIGEQSDITTSEPATREYKPVLLTTMAASELTAALSNQIQGAKADLQQNRAKSAQKNAERNAEIAADSITQELEVALLRKTFVNGKPEKPFSLQREGAACETTPFLRVAISLSMDATQSDIKEVAFVEFLTRARNDKTEKNVLRKHISPLTKATVDDVYIMEPTTPDESASGQEVASLPTSTTTVLITPPKVLRKGRPPKEQWQLSNDEFAFADYIKSNIKKIGLLLPNYNSDLDEEFKPKSRRTRTITKPIERDVANDGEDNNDREIDTIDLTTIDFSNNVTDLSEAPAEDFADQDKHSSELAAHDEIEDDDGDEEMAGDDESNLGDKPVTDLRQPPLDDDELDRKYDDVIVANAPNISALPVVTPVVTGQSAASSVTEKQPLLPVQRITRSNKRPSDEPISLQSKKSKN